MPSLELVRSLLMLSDLSNMRQVTELLYKHGLITQEELNRVGPKCPLERVK